MSRRDVKSTLIANGVSEEQAEIIAEGIKLARDRSNRIAFEVPALRTVRRSFFTTSDSSGKDFREFHALVTKELRTLSPAEIAFGDIPDSIREQFSAFCWAMYSGHQERYLDRHEDEDPIEFLNRPQKRTLNVTKLVINTLSKLYHKPPVREFPVTKGEEGTPSTIATPEHIRKRLEEIWTGELFNRSMLESDRRTRLMGTIAVRPMYDPKIPGGIRLWLYMSHQLRVIPDPAAPWRAAAVIERVHPFGKTGGATIWTDEWFVELGRTEVEVVKHELGRIPHVFLHDQLSYTSFFVEGRGRILCTPNAIMNNDLADLEEVKQMQGFSVMELVNPVEDDIRIGPREAFTFRPADKTIPFGVNFKAPRSPLAELRADAEGQLNEILSTNGVPAAALGAEINRRTLSGAAIRAAMQPIISDNKERESLFKPIEHDLADSMLRVIRRHEPGFVYTEDMRPGFVLFYQPLEFPLDTRDQVVKDDFDVSQGIETPATIMRRDNPDLYPTHEDALAQWKKNLAETRDGGIEIGGDSDGPDLRASYGGFSPVEEGRAKRDDDEYSSVDLMEDMLASASKSMLANSKDMITNSLLGSTTAPKE